MENVLTLETPDATRLLEAVLSVAVGRSDRELITSSSYLVSVPFNSLATAEPSLISAFMISSFSISKEDNLISSGFSLSNKVVTSSAGVSSKT